jgi:hypothetical protein
MNYTGPGKSSSILIDVLSPDIPTHTGEKKRKTRQDRHFPITNLMLTGIPTCLFEISLV